jgi:N-formylglutamate amidohydrolase
MSTFPAQCVFHVAHDSTYIPEEVLDQFVLDKESELASEVLKMTDHFTDEIFCAGVSPSQVVRATVSRLVVDVERFENDNLEPMAGVGMGAVYMKISSGGALRRPISEAERDWLMNKWYRPHHDRLAALVAATVQQYGSVLIIDVHSYQSIPLPYEFDRQLARPEICIGVDEFHTPSLVRNAFVSAFEHGQFDVAVNSPFGGSIVPAAYFKSDRRVHSIMVEVRRDLYMNEASGDKKRSFEELAGRIRTCMRVAANVTSSGSL